MRTFRIRGSWGFYQFPTVVSEEWPSLGRFFSGAYYRQTVSSGVAISELTVIDPEPPKLDFPTFSAEGKYVMQRDREIVDALPAFGCLPFGRSGFGVENNFHRL
jgi:hypothetical protein